LTNLNPNVAINAAVLPTDRIIRFAAEFGVQLNPQQIGSIRLPQTEKSMMCSSWMSYYFSLVGDQVPNSDNEIHLEPIPKKDVYKEYVFDMEIRKEESMTEKSFVKLWKQVFPYVKVRKYKSSCGHCNLCTLLGEKRRKFRDMAGRQEVTNLFAIHRLSTMGERRTYYDRRMEASMNSHLCLSTIADGMQQNHCTLPWFGNTKMPGVHIKQHLQGVLMHGQNMTIYRTFANVGGGANLAIHTWLLSLENYYRLHNSKLPPILYHQFDGGSENCNAEFVAICSLLVACGLVNKVVLTRLPVGHTHEDIDGLFALIWRKLRDEFVYTPSDFVKLIQLSLRKKVYVNVIDLMVIPNYTKILDGCIDPNLGRWAKEEWAQLQLTFERAEKSAENLLGVKTTYRPYVQDEFIEIVEDLGPKTEYSSVCGLIPQLCECKTHPLPGEPALNWLHKIPSASAKFEPDAFITDSNKAMQVVAEKMMTSYAIDKPSVAAEWEKWINDAPGSDNSHEYRSSTGGIMVQTSGSNTYETDGNVYVPFRNQLFGHTGVNELHVDPRPRNLKSAVGGLNMRKVESTSAVLHSGNKSAAAKQVPARKVVQDLDGTAPLVPYGSLNSAYPGRAGRRELAKKKSKKTKDAKAQKIKDAKAQKKAEMAGSESEHLDDDLDDSTSSEVENEAEKGQQSNHHVHKVGDAVVNNYNLAATVTAIYDEGGVMLYDLAYNNKKHGINSKLNGAYVYPKPPTRQRGSKRSGDHWDIVALTGAKYVNDGDIDNSNIMKGARRNVG
jgi:hypothetical protein